MAKNHGKKSSARGGGLPGVVAGLQFRIGWSGKTRGKTGSGPYGYVECIWSRFGEQKMQSPDLWKSIPGGFRKQEGNQGLGQK